MLEDSLVRVHCAISYKENSLHIADNEMEKEVQLHGKYRMAWNHGGCSYVFSVALWDRKIILGALQRIGGKLDAEQEAMWHDIANSTLIFVRLPLSLYNFPCS